MAAPKHSMRQFVEHQLAQHLSHQQQLSGSNASTRDAAATAAAANAQQGAAVQLWYVMTRSGVHTAVAPLLQGLADVQELFPGQIKSEAELKQQLQLFLGAGTCNDSRSSTISSSSSSAAGQPAPVRLLVLHAEAPAAAAELRHMRSFVLDCVTAATSTAAAGNTAAPPAAAWGGHAATASPGAAAGSGSTGAE